MAWVEDEVGNKKEMEEANAMQHQHHHHQQQQQRLMMLHQLQQQQQQETSIGLISRFPSNIHSHLRPINPQQNPNPNPNPNSSNQSQLDLQNAYQDAWRICHPDFKRPFSSLRDACLRLLPYHVVADYEAEEDDRLLDSDTTGKVLSRSQQWDNNISAKIAEFTATFEKQALAFNIISQKRGLGEFRSEERLMIEQALLQEEKRAMFELRVELESREKADREAHEAKLRMAAMVQAQQARAHSQSRAEMMSCAPIRGSALLSHGIGIISDHNMGEQNQGGNPSQMINGWGNNAQRDEKEPSDDFLNDEAENGETGTQDSWREVGEFDLNCR
ncbi:hypothetical protein TanjilG_23353 [Lupinus angustifolius]|uniref:GLTSCR protein conserved domain-containing protein n=1 Tax=Lupinus angustifolius TaxID=3871 RepID=A0A4P1R969_LUPAN|nr:PREDICTED: uncharacterized protein LOC109353342 [Lupinus angustifolius]OIW05567.1 hypothetical protein TanjilG_23353 [Lupinus angustifolius]